MTDDAQVRDRINEITDEIKRVRGLIGSGEIDPATAQVEIDKLQTELDQSWDLLRQREAREEFGQDPDQAKTRSASTVENYLD